MNDELEPDDELEDDGPSIAFIFGDEPDYEEWARLKDKDYASLSDSICYAIRLHIDPKDRSESCSFHEEAHSYLLNRGISDILSGQLRAEEVGTEYWVTKSDFYKWVKEQDVELNPQFLNLEPPKGKIIQRAEIIGRVAKEEFNDPLAITYGGKAELRTLLCKQYRLLFTRSTFDKAWIKAKSDGLVEVENVEQYKTAK